MQAIICEDNKQDQFQLRRILESGGYDVAAAFENGRELMDWLKANPGKAHVIVMDLIMPVLDGYATLFEMIEEKMQYRVVIASVENSREVVTNLLQHGIMNFISKPLDRATVLEKINAVMLKAAPRLGKGA